MSVAGSVWLMEGVEGGSEMEKLGSDKIECYLTGEHRGALEEMIREDRAIASEIESIAEVERLVCYSRDLSSWTGGTSTCALM